jgi:hypothetical protein
MNAGEEESEVAQPVVKKTLQVVTITEMGQETVEELVKMRKKTMPEDVVGIETTTIRVATITAVMVAIDLEATLLEVINRTKADTTGATMTIREAIVLETKVAIKVIIIKALAIIRLRKTAISTQMALCVLISLALSLTSSNSRTCRIAMRDSMATVETSTISLRLLMKPILKTSRKNKTLPS